jgi:hypothetical protein
VVSSFQGSSKKTPPVLSKMLLPVLVNNLVVFDCFDYFYIIIQEFKKNQSDEKKQIYRETIQGLMFNYNYTIIFLFLLFRTLMNLDSDNKTLLINTGVIV